MADSTTAHEVVIVDDFDPVDTPGSYALLTLRPLGKDMIGLRERSLQKDDEIILGRSSRTSQDPSMRPQGDNFRFESPVMSRSHALIKFDGVRLNIVDTDSLHGTFVNGERVIPNTATPLNNGDVLKLGAKVYRNDASHEAIEFGFSSHIVGVWADGLVEDSTAADYAYHSEPEDFDESDSTDHHHESSSSAPTTPEKTEARVIHIEDDNKLAGKNGFFGSRTRPIFLEDVEESVAETNTEHPVIVADPHGDIESLKSQVDHSIHCLEKIITGHIESYTTGIAPVGIDQNEARCSDQCEIEDNDDQSECDSCSDGDDHSESSESESWNWSVPEADENETQLPSDAERASDDLALPPSTDSAFPNAKWAEMPFAPSGYNPTKPIFDPVRHAENEQAVICSHFSPTNSISQFSAPDVLTPDQKHSSHGNETIPSHLSFSDELVIRDSFGQVTTDSNTHDPTELGLKTKVSIASLIDERTPQGPLSSSGTGSDWVCAQDANPLLSFTSNHGDEVSTQDEYSQCITADVLSSRKRKAGAFEDGSAWETAEPAPKKLMLAAETVLDPAGSYDLACAARRHQRRAALRQVASKATHVAAGAMLGMVGTIVFLSSSYAEQMIEWLN